MCSRGVDRDTGGLDHINTTNKYNHDQQLSTIIYQDAGSGALRVVAPSHAQAPSHCNYDHQLSTVNNDEPIWLVSGAKKFIDIDDSKKYANLLPFIR
jgi:hypothetical protein